MDDVRLSKFLSLVLRHEPGKIGIELNAAGWTEVEVLLAACGRHGVALTRERLEQVVAGSDKQRFAFDETRRRIRASQGHSVSVELGYEPMAPPEKLYHGTVAKFIDAIRAQGLIKGARHHVHLSANEATAANGVWLVDHVPPPFIAFPPERDGGRSRTRTGDP